MDMTKAEFVEGMEEFRKQIQGLAASFPATPNLNKALADARGKFPAIHKGRTATVKTKAGPSYSYDYADLADVLDSVQPILSVNGLVLTHEQSTTREPLGVETVAVLLHESGEEKRGLPCWLPCSGDMQPTQAIGSAMTYGRRYTTGPILGIAPEADDDGNAASGNDATTAPKAAKPVCPKCGKNQFVYENKPDKGPGFFCWKKPDAGKHGCGNQWTPDAEGSQEPAGMPDDRRLVEPKAPPKKQPHAGLVALLSAMVGQGNVAGNEIVIEHFGSTKQACLDDEQIAANVYQDISLRAGAIEKEHKCDRKKALTILTNEIMEAHQKGHAK
jgi:hypothetical protein